jgi:hypothetical protein
LWRTDDLSFGPLHALMTYVRAAAERSVESITAIYRTVRRPPRHSARDRALPPSPRTARLPTSRMSVQRKPAHATGALCTDNGTWDGTEAPIWRYPHGTTARPSGADDLCSRAGAFCVFAGCTRIRQFCARAAEADLARQIAAASGRGPPDRQLRTTEREIGRSALSARRRSSSTSSRTLSRSGPTRRCGPPY